MVSYAEVLLVGLLTLALVIYCLVDVVRRTPPVPGRPGWIAALGLGAIVWPVGWVASFAYLLTRRKAR